MKTQISIPNFINLKKELNKRQNLSLIDTTSEKNGYPSNIEKATPKEVLKANEFYTWFQNLGGNLTTFNAENIINSCSNTALKFSSFKANPEDTKKRLNHKFTFNL